MADGADIKITANTKDAQRQLKKTSKSVSGLAQNAKKLGGAIGGAIAATALIGGLKRVSQEFRTFEREILNVTTLTDRLSFKKIRNEIMGLDTVLGTSADLTRGLYQALSAGVSAEKGVKFVARAAKFAKAAVTDTSTSVDVLTTALNAYGLKTKETTRISDVFFQTIKEGKLNGQQLSAAMGTVLSTSAILGVGIKEVGASLATMTKKGEKSQRAATQLRSLFAALLKTTVPMKAALKDFGYESGEALVKTQGLTGALEFLIQASEGSAEKMLKLLRSQEAFAAAANLTGDAMKEYNNVLGNLEKSAGATDKAFEKRTDNIEKLRASFESLTDAIGFYGVSIARAAANSGLDNVFTDAASGLRAAARKSDLKISLVNKDEIEFTKQNFLDIQKIVKEISAIRPSSPLLYDGKLTAIKKAGEERLKYFNLQHGKLINQYQDLKKQAELLNKEIPKINLPIGIEGIDRLQTVVQEAVVLLNEKINENENTKVKVGVSLTDDTAGYIEALELYELEKERVGLLQIQEEINTANTKLAGDMTEEARKQLEYSSLANEKIRERIAEINKTISSGGAESYQGYINQIESAERAAQSAKLSTMNIVERTTHKYDEQIKKMDELIQRAIALEGAESDRVRTLKEQRDVISEARTAAVSRVTTSQKPSSTRSRSRSSSRSTARSSRALRSRSEIVRDTTLAERHMNNEKIRGLEIDLKKIRALKGEAEETERLRRKMQDLIENRNLAISQGGKSVDFIKFSEEEIEKIEKKLKTIDAKKIQQTNIENQIERLREENARLRESFEREKEDARNNISIEYEGGADDDDDEESDRLIELAQAADFAFAKINKGLSELKKTLANIPPKKLLVTLNLIKWWADYYRMYAAYKRIRSREIRISISIEEGFEEKVKAVNAIYETMVEVTGRVSGNISSMAEAAEKVSSRMGNMAKHTYNMAKNAIATNKTLWDSQQVPKVKKTDQKASKPEGLFAGGVVPAAGSGYGDLYRLGERGREAVVPLEQYNKLIRGSKESKAGTQIINIYVNGQTATANIKDEFIRELVKKIKVMKYKGSLNTKGIT